MENFKENLVDILDVDIDELDMDAEFAEMEAWDSLAQLSFIAMAQDEYGKNISNEQLKKARTFNELYKLILDV